MYFAISISLKDRIKIRFSLWVTPKTCGLPLYVLVASSTMVYAIVLDVTSIYDEAPQFFAVNHSEKPYLNPSVL